MIGVTGCVSLLVEREWHHHLSPGRLSGILSGPELKRLQHEVHALSCVVRKNDRRT